MFQLQIAHCHRDDVDSINHALEATEALSVTFTDEFDDPILEPELGTTPLWPHVVIQALYTEEQEATIAQQVITSSYPHLSYTVEKLPEQDWERVCMDQFQPQRFGNRLWICPTWLTPPHPEAINLILDPGLAFGTGTHPTTSLCLQWLEQASLTGYNIIDYGCGSGVLALAALKLGAAHVAAVDIDEQALLATQNNAATNQFTAKQLTVGLPESLSTPVDLITANILLAPLLQLQHRFDELLNDNGTLVVSGILAEQVNELVDTYKTSFKHTTTLLQDEWALVVFTSTKNK